MILAAARARWNQWKRHAGISQRDGWNHRWPGDLTVSANVNARGVHQGGDRQADTQRSNTLNTVYIPADAASTTTAALGDKAAFMSAVRDLELPDGMDCIGGLYLHNAEVLGRGMSSYSRSARISDVDGHP